MNASASVDQLSSFCTTAGFPIKIVDLFRSWSLDGPTLNELSTSELRDLLIQDPVGRKITGGDVVLVDQILAAVEGVKQGENMVKQYFDSSTNVGVENPNAVGDNTANSSRAANGSMADLVASASTASVNKNANSANLANTSNTNAESAPANRDRTKSDLHYENSIKTIEAAVKKTQELILGHELNVGKIEDQIKEDESKFDFVKKAKNNAVDSVKSKYEKRFADLKQSINSLKFTH